MATLRASLPGASNDSGGISGGAVVSAVIDSLVAVVAAMAEIMVVVTYKKKHPSQACRIGPVVVPTARKTPGHRRASCS
jgi:hypothetical protein